MDRRTIRTENLIKETFTNLLMIKNIKDITVTEITNMANLDRRTFYLHYKDIYDLNDKIIEEFLNKFRKVLESSKCTEMLNQNPLSFIRIILNYLFENRNLCIANLSTNYNNDITEQLLHIVHDKVFDIIKKTFPKCTDAQMEMFYTFCIYGCFGIIINWISTGLLETEENIIIQIEKIVKCTASYLENND